MLAAPLQSTPAFNDKDLTQYRPAKDLQAFNALLPPPVEFVKGSSSSTITAVEGKYEPINGTPSVEDSQEAGSSNAPPSSPAKSPKNPRGPAAPTKSLYPGTIDLAWPVKATRGTGFVNTGNTCFLNSALQCLVHTPPLLQVLIKHSKSEPCLMSKNAFCMSCNMRDLAMESFSATHAIVPYSITKGLQQIAKHLRRGRQEDSHEFLRYAIDAFQKSCLAGQPQKIDPKLAETTWVHQIFGGRLRSRVTCLSCDYNSDTFDSILDLSIDIFGINNLKDALRKFVAIDHLRGANKYKCDKCKKHVSANKQFTIHEAPMVLTVHLKRFTPMGRKIGHPVRYDETLSLQHVMSEGQHGPTYTLYGVISHAGSGPNSGHYYAHVKDANGAWFEMNDDSVSRHHGPPLGLKNAYILFYIRNKGQALEAALSSARTSVPAPPRVGVVAGMKKRKIVDSDNEDEAPPSKRFIGPLLPSPEISSAPTRPSKPSEPKPDPQAEVLKRKIAQKQTSTPASPVKPSAALASLSQYDDDDDDDIGEPAGKPDAPSPSSPAAASTSALSPRAASSPVTPASALPPASPISTQSFYASSTSKAKETIDDESKKRKLDEDDDMDGSLRQYARTRVAHTTQTAFHKYSNKHNRMRGGRNPFSRLTGGNNLSGSPPKKLLKKFAR